MKKLIIYFVSVFLIMLSVPTNLQTFAIENDYFDGKGTLESPYQIKSEVQLKQLSELLNNDSTSSKYVDAYYVQMSDINISEDFISIGRNESMPFQGTYDGNYCSIINLSINSNNQYNGLFGYVKSGEIKNLSVYGNISSTNSSSSSTTGGIIGTLSDGASVINCSFNGNISGKSEGIGGIAGQIINSGTINGCYVNSSISGNVNVGGLVGSVYDYDKASIVSINHSYVAGSITNNANAETVGGIVGSIVNSNLDSIVNMEVNLYLSSSCPLGAVQSSKYIGCTPAAAAALKAWYDELGTPFTVNNEQNGFNDGYPIFEWQSTPYAFIGDGTADNPYQISNKEEISIMRDLINSKYSNGKYNSCYYIQTSDIDLEGEEWIPIGKRLLNGEEANLSFLGNYNGQGYEIRNLYVNRNEKFAGLFGSYNGNKFIENLIVYGNVSSTSNSVGGICGEVCNGGGTIRNCAFLGDVKGTDDSVGGIVGFAWHNANIENCYHNGVVSSKQSAGGIVGRCTTGWEKATNITISNSYHVGNINGEFGKAGGIVGFCEKGTEYQGNIYVNNCYYLKDGISQGLNGSCTIDDTIALSSNLLKSVATDLGSIYVTNKDASYNNGYPVFIFQNTEGVLGDVNLDGSFKISDAVMLQKWLLGSGKLTCWENADLCQDGKIDVFDFVMMKKYLVDLGGTSSGIPISITLNKSSQTLTVSQTVQISATVVPETIDNLNVSWSSSNSSIATVDANGLVKAVAPGKSIITAKTSTGNKYASCEITVLSPTIKLNATNKTMLIDAYDTLIATVTPAEAKVTWSSSNTKCILVDNGKIKAIAATSNDVTITAKITIAGKDYTATCKVKVENPSISLNKSSISMYIGDTSTLSASVTPTDVSVSYSSSNSNVASVSSSGKITGVSNGEATITASFIRNGITYSAKCSVTIIKPAISLSAYSGSIYQGDTKYLSADTNPSGYSVSWSSSNNNVASVSGGTITGKSAGSATITASFTYAGKTYSNSYAVTVNGLSLSLSSYSGSGNFDVYSSGLYSEGAGFSVNLPSVTKSPSNASISWSLISGSGWANSYNIVILQPGTVTARCTMTYNGYSTYRDYTYSLSTYKTTGGNNNIRSGPGDGYSILGKVPVGTTVSIYELSGNANSGSIWGKVNYNGISGWIIISNL